MNTGIGTRICRACLLALVLVVFVGPVQAAGLLSPSDGSLPALEIRDHRVEVLIEDGYAITR